MPGGPPPTYAWDWLARQRLVWQECRSRILAATPPASGPSPTPPPAVSRGGGDVPDWSSDHPDLRFSQPQEHAREETGPHRDYRPLGTRAEVVAALRIDYPERPWVRAVVDSVVTELAFLGRLDASPGELGVRSVPRGMQWWWSHLSGRAVEQSPSAPQRDSEPRSTVPLQLRLVDVLAGYGDAMEP
jgi:hypothetical protein